VLDRLGYRGEELIGRSVLMVHPEPRRDEALEILGGMLAGTVDYCPVPLVCKDGSQIPVATRVSEGRWNGRPALFGVSRDVGDRIRAQRELEESEARYRSMFEDNKAIKLLVDPESGLVVEANSAAGEFYGRSREALTGTPVRDLLVGDDLAMPCSTEDARVVSQRHRIKDGSVREVELHCSTLFFGERRLVYAIVHDVTERKRAERERQSNMHFLERMMDTIPLPVFYKDTTGIYLGCNQAYADFLGKAKLEIIGNTMDVAGTGEVARLCQLKDEALMASPGFQVYEHYMYNGSGEKRNVLFYKASFNNVEGTLGGIIGAMVDVTDEVEARTEREGLIDKLTRALEDVKTLRGFLPICSSCKKIRDDSGYWQQIEAYISTHSNAEFSHSICPECYKDLYPDLAAEDDDA
jgi:PAS domain S-box-containing protein